MAIVHVSSKGQITLPSAIRKEVGIQSDSKVEIQVRDAEIVIKPVRSVREVKGLLREYARGKTTDWDTIREQTMQTVAEEIVHEDRP